MSTEWFYKLKEIDSLEKMRINHLKTIDEQNLRLGKLKARSDENNSRLATLQQEYFALQQALHETEKKLKTASAQKQHLIDLGGDEKKIARFTQEIAAFEDEGMEFLLRMETHEQETKDARQFGEGVLKTVSEIGAEVNELRSKLEVEMKNIDLRVALLMDELPADYKALLVKTMNKKLAHGPFTRIEAGSCFFCRFKISRQDESEVDMQKLLKVCPQCTRIFIPFGV